METRQQPLKRDGGGAALISGHQSAARARLTLTEQQEPVKSSKGQQTA